MKKSVYTILFMVFISAFFISLLAFINELSREKIQTNEQIEKYKSILYAFNIYPDGLNDEKMKDGEITAAIPWRQENLFRIFSEKIKKIKIPLQEEEKKQTELNPFIQTADSLELYLKLNDNDLESIGFYLNGKGLWGTIESFCVINSDLTSLEGIDFVKQSETPGLGARILENWFKIHFRNLTLDNHSSSSLVSMSAQKEHNNMEKPTNRFEAVTGATLTSRGVLETLNVNLPFYIAFIKNHQSEIHSHTKE